MDKIQNNLDTTLNDPVAFSTIEINNKSYTTGIVFVRWFIQASFFRTLSAFINQTSSPMFFVMIIDRNLSERCLHC